MKKISLLMFAAAMAVFSFGQTTINVDDYFTTKTENPKFTTTDGAFTFSAAKGGASNVPLFNLGYNGADNDIRNYANGVFTIESKKTTMKAIQFVMSSKGLEQWADLSASSGSATADVSSAITTWVAENDTNYVDFTVGATNKYGTSTKTAGQFDFKQIIIYVTGDPDPEIPEVNVDTIVLNIHGAYFQYYEEYSEAGAYNYFTVLADTVNGVGVAFDLYMEEMDKFPGVYNVDNDNLDVNYSYYYFGEGDDDYSDPDDAWVTITAVGSKYNFKGGMLVGDKLYVFDYTGDFINETPDPWGYEPQEVSTLNVTATDADYDDSYLSYGEVDVYLNNENSSLLLMFLVEDLDEQTVIPVGTYQINDSETEGTVYACMDGVSEYGVIGTYLMTDFVEDETGEMVPETAYFIESGTVKVEKTDKGMKFTVNCKSHYGSTINVVYEGEFPGSSVITGVENISEFDKAAPAYNVLGMPVDMNYRGVVIQNGKKFILR